MGSLQLYSHLTVCREAFSVSKEDNDIITEEIRRKILNLAQFFSAVVNVKGAASCTCTCIYSTADETRHVFYNNSCTCTVYTCAITTCITPVLMCNNYMSWCFLLAHVVIAAQGLNATKGICADTCTCILVKHNYKHVYYM